MSNREKSRRQVDGIYLFTHELHALKLYGTFLQSAESIRDADLSDCQPEALDDTLLQRHWRKTDPKQDLKRIKKRRQLGK